MCIRDRANAIVFARWRCYERNFNLLNCLPSRTYSAGRLHVGFCPKFLVLFYFISSHMCEGPLCFRHRRGRHVWRATQVEIRAEPSLPVIAALVPRNTQCRTDSKGCLPSVLYYTPPPDETKCANDRRPMSWRSFSKYAVCPKTGPLHVFCHDFTKYWPTHIIFCVSE